MTAHTPGPWRWEVNRAHKSVKLCGGPPKQGYGKYDLTVLGFKRYGMTGAAPEFWDWNLQRLYGTPHRADELAIAVDGREHHSDWFADIDHPDARLIAAAPCLLDALNEAESFISGFEDDELQEGVDEMLRRIRDAISKATGS